MYGVFLPDDQDSPAFEESSLRVFACIHSGRLAAIWHHLTVPLRIILMVVLATTGCGQMQGSSRYHLKGISSAVLLNSASSWRGFDVTEIYEWAVSDDELLNSLVERWQLQRTDQLRSSVTVSDYAWWPSNEQLGGMEQKYWRVESKDERFYVNVWATVPPGRVYLEAGDL
jgi:hypothetical protein